MSLFAARILSQRTKISRMPGTFNWMALATRASSPGWIGSHPRCRISCSPLSRTEIKFHVSYGNSVVQRTSEVPSSSAKPTVGLEFVRTLFGLSIRIRINKTISTASCPSIS
jgi:hypothetical protein